MNDLINPAMVVFDKSSKDGCVFSEELISSLWEQFGSLSAAALMHQAIALTANRQYSIVAELVLADVRGIDGRIEFDRFACGRPESRSTLPDIVYETMGHLPFAIALFPGIF